MILRKTILLEKMINEALSPEEQELKDRLSPKVVAILSSGGNWENGGVSSKWSDAKNNCSSKAEEDALVELFIRLNLPKYCNCGFSVFQPSLDVLIHIFKACGFKTNENPFINFCKAFYDRAENKNYTIPRDGWVTLNDAYATGLLQPGDLMGTGLDRRDNIIFNKSFYENPENISSDSDNMLSSYYWLSTPANIDKLDLVTVSTVKGEYSVLKNYADPKTGHLAKGSGVSFTWKDVRNTILFKDPTKPRGEINKYYYVKKAINLGITNQRDQSGNTQQPNTTINQNNNNNNNNNGGTYKQISTQISNTNNLTQAEANKLISTLQANMNSYRRR